MMGHQLRCVVNNSVGHTRLTKNRIGKRQTNVEMHLLGKHLKDSGLVSMAWH